MLREFKVLYTEMADGEARVRAAGALIVAEDTGNILLIFRSSKCYDPNLWCGVGGKIEEGETPEEACRREVFEEIGFDPEEPMTLKPILVYEDDKLQFHNFVALVPNEFTPTLNWESAGYVWCNLSHLPGPKHYGLEAILDDPYSTGMLNGLVNSAETQDIEVEEQDFKSEDEGDPDKGED